MPTQPDTNRPRSQAPSNGGLFGGLFGGGGGGAEGGASGIAGFFQALMQLFTGGGSGGGGLFGGLFGLGTPQAPTPQQEAENTQKTIINEQQADLAAKGLYPGTGRFAQDGTAGAVMQHAMRLDSDPNYARQHMRSALRDPNLDATDIMKIQASLNKLGYDVGDVNGRMNNETRADLDKFLRDNPDVKRAVPAQTAESTAPRGGVMGWIMDKVESVRNVRDHALAPATTPGSVKGLLGIIGQHESRQNYNAIWPKTEGNGTDFTRMTVNEVLAYQRNYTRNEGNASSAVGRYQIIQGTLRGLKEDMGLSGNERFDAAMQDRMAVRLLEQRGLNDFRNGRISPERFMDNVAREWASMPNRHGRGHYDGDGLNAVGVSIAPVRNAMMDILKPAAPEAPTRVAAARTQDVDFSRPAQRTHNSDSSGLTGMARSAFSTASSVIDKVDDALDTARSVVTAPFRQLAKVDLNPFN